MEPLVNSLLSVVVFIFISIVIMLTIIFLYIKKEKEYKESSYYQVTKLSYKLVCNDVGRCGEYFVYKRLKHLEVNGAKFLFNVYIPKGNGETTEIDVLMIHSKGIFVFESKNYSGWIFGNESQRKWCQTLPTKKGKCHKEYFYNPIMQNRSHIKYLNSFLDNRFTIRSIIVFSDKCTLKNVQIKSDDINVVKRCDVACVVSAIIDRISIDVLSESVINEVYNKLYPLTQVDNIAKAQHIANIYNNLNRKSEQQIDTEYTSIMVTDIPLEASEVCVESVSENMQSPVVRLSEQIPINIDHPVQRSSMCPRCKGRLVLRTATRGLNAGNQFYGCSNYPKCRYIKNITNKMA